MKFIEVMNLNIVVKSLTVISLIYGIAIIQSCCDNPTTQYYQVKIFTINNFNLNSFDEVLENSSIDYSSYSIRIQFDIELLSKTTNGLISSLVAQSCDDDLILKPHNIVKKAEISATSDFNEDYLRGSSLNYLFKYKRLIKECIENGGGNSCGENQLQFEFNNSLEDVINNSFSRNDYYNSIDTRFTTLNLATLKEQPTLSDSLQFIFTLTLEDGQVLSDTTEYVKFN